MFAGRANCKYKSLDLKGETVDAGGLKWDQDQDLPPPRGRRGALTFQD